MSQYKLIQTIPYSGEEYEDENRPIKNALTDFVNDYFLTYNHNILMLLKLIYDTITPILTKYKLILVFKGGNVMRLINNNLKEYLRPLETDIIEDVFEPFLKKSDNDFTVYIYPNLDQYDMFINKVTEELYMGLNVIKDELIRNPTKYFNLFNLSNLEISNAFKKLDKELNVNSSKLYPAYNKLVQLQNPKDRRSDVLIFNDMDESYKYIFNSLNTSISFLDSKEDLIKFYLLRSKINFKLGNNKESAGELIDISIPHRRDGSMKKFHSFYQFNQYLNDNIQYEYNEEYNFGYHTVNINYLVNDLFRILYVQSNNPWDNNKYEKRLARLIYFIFIKELDSRPLSQLEHVQVYDNFKVFLRRILTLNIAGIGKQKDELDLIVKYTIDLDLKTRNNQPEREKFKKYVTDIVKYTKAILRIFKAMFRYHDGLEKIDPNVIYDIDVE